jgi:exonuclease VII small subunit
MTVKRDFEERLAVLEQGCRRAQRACLALVEKVQLIYEKGINLKPFCR